MGKHQVGSCRAMTPFPMQWTGDHKGWLLRSRIRDSVVVVIRSLLPVHWKELGRDTPEASSHSLSRRSSTAAGNTATTDVREVGTWPRGNTSAISVVLRANPSTHTSP